MAERDAVMIGGMLHETVPTRGCRPRQRAQHLPPQTIAILAMLVATLAIYFFYLADLR